jgi:hypothetical protein
MKTNTVLSVSMLILAMAASAWAVTPGTSASQGSAFNKESQKTAESLFDGAPTRLGFGAYYAQQKRGIDVGGRVEDWKIKHTVGYVTVDITRWLTVLGGAGESDVTREFQSGDGDMEWIAGGTLRLFNYFAMDPIVGEDPYWLSIDLEGQYTDASAGSLSWNEVYGALLFNIMAKTERWGFVDSVSLYLGPAFSAIDGSNDFGGDFVEDQSIGFVFGVAFCPSDNLTIKTELQKFDSLSWGLGASFHF